MFAIELIIKDKEIRKYYLARGKNDLLYWADTLLEIEYYSSSCSGYCVAINFMTHDKSAVSDIIKNHESEMTASISQCKCAFNSIVVTVLTICYENSHFAEYATNQLTKGNLLLG